MADSNLKVTITAVDKASKTLGGVSGKMKAMAAAAAAAGAAAAVALGGQAIRAASDLSETMSKSEVLFGDAAGSVQAFAAQAATSLGQSKQSALDAASTFATFGQGAGLAGQDLATFSTDLVSLSSDMASFANTSPEEAVQAIGAALRGESEPIRKYGVLLDDATLRAEALKLGLVKTTKEALTPQQKVLAAQAAIMKQTTTAQGDFARTSDGLANQQRIMTAQFENAKASIGSGLLPVVTALTTKMNELIQFVQRNQGWLIPLVAGIAAVAAATWAANAAFAAQATIVAAGGLAAYLKTLPIVRVATSAWTAVQWVLNAALTANPIGLVVVAIAALIAGVVLAYKKSETFRNIVQTALRGVKNAFDALKTGAVAALNWVRSNWDTIVTVVKNSPLGLYIRGVIAVFTTFKDKAVGAVKWVRTKFSDFVAFFKKIPDAFSKANESIKNAVMSPFKAAFNAIATLWNNTVGRISINVPSWVPGMGGNGFSVPQIPTMAVGGKFLSDGLVYGHKGETITPAKVVRGERGYGGGGGVTNVFNISGVIGDKEGVARTITDVLRRYGGNGAVKA